MDSRTDQAKHNADELWQRVDAKGDAYCALADRIGTCRS